MKILVSRTGLYIPEMGRTIIFFCGKLGWAISVQECSIKIASPQKNNNGPFLLAKSTKDGKETGHNERDNSSVLHYKHGMWHHF